MTHIRFTPTVSVDLADTSTPSTQKAHLADLQTENAEAGEDPRGKKDRAEEAARSWVSRLGRPFFEAGGVHDKRRTRSVVMTHWLTAPDAVPSRSSTRSTMI